MFGDSNHGAANFIAERAPESGGLTIVEGDGSANSRRAAAWNVTFKD